jgi:hypothetical protein
VNHRIKVAEIQSADRPDGYLEACMALGSVDGEWITFTDDAYRQIRERFNPHAADPMTLRLIDLANGVPLCRGCGE